MQPAIMAAAKAMPTQNAGSLKLPSSEVMPSMMLPSSISKRWPYLSKYSKRDASASLRSELLKKIVSATTTKIGMIKASKNGERLEKLETSMNHVIIGNIHKMNTNTGTKSPTITAM